MLLLGFFIPWCLADTETGECEDEVPDDLLDDQDDEGRDHGGGVTVFRSVHIFVLNPGSKTSIDYDTSLDTLYLRNLFLDETKL